LRIAVPPETLLTTESKTGFDIGLLTEDDRISARCEQLSRDFGFTLARWSSLEEFKNSPAECKLVICSLAQQEVQAVRSLNKDAFIVCAVTGTLAKETAHFAKKSGADLILLKEEFFDTGKLEFTSLQVIRSSHLPIKAIDLPKDTEIPFDVYHLLPQRRKFLRFITAGDSLGEIKARKCGEVGEIYILREDAEAYSRFIASQPGDSAAFRARGCRAQYLALYASYSSLVFLLTDQSEHSSYGEGMSLLKKCQSLCSNLLGTLSDFDDAWSVINNSSIGELGSAERAPTVASYVGVFGLQAGFENIDRIMLAALLSDLGVFFLKPAILRKLRDDDVSGLSALEQTEFENYPNISLDLVLGRKLAMDDKMREMMLSTRERAAGDGFPRRLAGTRIPLGAQLIHYCREFDRRTMLKLGRPRPARAEVRNAMKAEDRRGDKIHTAEFWALIEKI
jgi:hypothetical protein